IYLFPKYRTYEISKSSRARNRGASPSSRSVARVVMDAFGAAGGCHRGGRASRVVLIPRRWDQPLGQEPGGWWLKRPDTRESAEQAVKPLRRECRSCRLYLS